ncbi:MAG: DUF5663 domain-containing protein [Candidatus Saccharibacteria bacterium]|nr:DUF5663 domain-containing protein [Candidatus Saccharibacteria bacterium]
MFGIADNQEFLTAIGIADASEETKNQLIAGIETLAEQRLVTALSDRLTDAEAEEFGKITDEQQARDWLMAKIPDFQDMVANILADIKNDILLHKAEVIGA